MEENERRVLEFVAHLPELQSAIKIGKDGMRIVIEVPESEMGNAVGIIQMRGAALKVTIERMPANGWMNSTEENNVF